jgi:hypothetical protein
MAKYPPYVNAYGKIPDVFDGIKTASVPPKVTVDFLSSVLGLKSSSYRAMIPLLKKLEFIDQASVPTEIYRSYRDISQSKAILGKQVKLTYEVIYKVAEYAHKLESEELKSKLKTLLGVADDDKAVPYVVGTFQELVKISSFETRRTSTKVKNDLGETTKKYSIKTEPDKGIDTNFDSNKTKFGISYTINLNLPATTEIEVYNSIFKALRENLLNE